MFCEAGELGARDDVSWRVLPVVYDAAALRLEEAIDELKPEVVIALESFGLPFSRPAAGKLYKRAFGGQSLAVVGGDLGGFLKVAAIRLRLVAGSSRNLATPNSAFEPRMKARESQRELETPIASTGDQPCCSSNSMGPFTAISNREGVRAGSSMKRMNSRSLLPSTSVKLSVLQVITVVQRSPEGA